MVRYFPLSHNFEIHNPPNFIHICVVVGTLMFIDVYTYTSVSVSLYGSKSFLLITSISPSVINSLAMPTVKFAGICKSVPEHLHSTSIPAWNVILWHVQGDDESIIIALGESCGTTNGTKVGNDWTQNV